MTNRTTVVGVFRDPDEARDAISALKDAGFTGEEIGLLMKDRDETRDMARETGSHAGEGAATGAVGGGILGGLAGWLVGIGAIAIPGVGPFIAAGALGTALAGAAIGAGVGAVAGALIGMGVPEEEAEWYEGEVRGGRTLVTVKADTRYDEARDILREYGAYDIEDRDRSDFATTSGMEDRGRGDVATTRGADEYWNRGMDTGYKDMDSDADLDDERTIQLREEELRARKKRERTGTVGMHKEVVSEEESLDVPVTREEPYVERRRVDRPSDRPVGESGDESIEMPVYEEQVHPEKETHVTEEIRMGKRKTTDTEHVSGTVRREEARFTNQGDFEVVGGEGFPDHEHNFAGGNRCTICGATRRPRRAA